MSFLLDTNILSAHLRRPSGLAHRFIQYSGGLYTSSIALAELFVSAVTAPTDWRSCNVLMGCLTRKLRS